MITYGQFSRAEIRAGYQSLLDTSAFVSKYVKAGTTVAYLAWYQTGATYHTDPDCPHFPTNRVSVHPLHKVSRQDRFNACAYCVADSVTSSRGGK